ncbi:GlsB/YeaQ/YmgE family stress response membrane protein [soil metagenome]
MWNLVSFILLGLIAGAIARLLVPGRHKLGLVRTAVLGMVGSFLGGFIGYLIGHDKGEGGLQVSGIFGSVVGAVIVLAIYTSVTNRDRRTLRRR